MMCSVCIFACNDKKYNPADLDSDDYPFAEETAENVLEYLDCDKDESLLAMFSESAIQGFDVDKQIDDAMDFFQGESTSYKTIRCGIRESKFREETYTYKSVRIVIEDVATDSDAEYDIELEYVLVCEEDKTQIGISKLFIRDTDESLENYCLIGEGGNYSND